MYIIIMRVGEEEEEEGQGTRLQVKVATCSQLRRNGCHFTIALYSE